MPSAPDSSGSLLSTPKQASGPESAPRDTEPTAGPTYSTLSPEAPPEAPTDDASPAPRAPTPPPASEVRSLPGAAESTTLHSAAHPGSGSMAQWDERRILHLEREFDQLSAQNRLLDKRLGDLAARFRALTVVGALFALLAALWLWARS